MRRVATACILSSGLFLVGCSIPGVGDTPGINECLGILGQSSNLKSELASANAQFNCSRQTDAMGNKFLSLTIGGKLDPKVSPKYPGTDFPQMLVVVVKRYDEYKGAVSDVGFGGNVYGDHLSPLEGTVPVKLGISTVLGQPASMRQVSPNMAFACIYATALGTKGTTTEVGICRSTTRDAPDSELLTMAKGQVASDFASVVP